MASSEGRHTITDHELSRKTTVQHLFWIVHVILRSSIFIQVHPISSSFIQFHIFHWWCSLLSNMDIHERWWSGDHFLEIVCWSVVWWGSMLRPWASKEKKRWCKEVYAHDVPQQWCWYGMKVTHSIAIYGGFLKYWYPTTMGFPTKNDHFGVFWVPPFKETSIWKRRTNNH